MQPTAKTKSTDFLPNKPSLDGVTSSSNTVDTNVPKSTPEVVAPELTATSPDTSTQAPAGSATTKTSTHVIDLKSEQPAMQNDSQADSQVAENPATSGVVSEGHTTPTPEANNSHPPTHSQPHKKGGKLKWLLIILAVVVLLIAAAIGGIYLAGMSSSSSSEHTGHSSM